MHTVEGGVTAEFVDVLTRLASAFPTTGKLSELTFRTYAKGLAAYSVEEIRTACARALEDGTLRNFFPSLPEMLGLLRPAADDQAMLAWAALRNAAAIVGAYASIEIEDEAAAVAVELVFGSWPDYCAQEDGPAMHGLRQEFMAVYREVNRRRTGAARRLPGLCEATGKAVRGPTVLAGRLTARGEALTLPDVAPAKALGDGR